MSWMSKVETALLPFHAISVTANLFAYYSIDFTSPSDPSVDHLSSALVIVGISQLLGLFSSRYLLRKRGFKELKREDEELCLKKKHDKSIRESLFTRGAISLFQFICSISVYFIVIVLLGAPLFKQQRETLLLSLFMVFANIVPFLVIRPPKKNRKLMSLSESKSVSLWDRLLLQTPFRCDDTVESFLLINFYLVSFGAWIGAFFLKLDWNEPWKVYPLTSIVSLLAFNTFSHFFAMCHLLKKLII